MGTPGLEVETGSLFQQAVEEMRAKGYTNRFIFSPPEKAARVKVDREKILRLLLILLDNAAINSPPGSEITLEAVSDSEHTTVSVMDLGPGIPEPESNSIFEPFYQASWRSAGSGLRLFIAKGIVKAHGGRIWHEPRKGGGSIFRFTIQ